MDTVSVDRSHIIRAAARHDPVVAGAIDYFLGDYNERRRMRWIDHTRTGDFAAIPANIDFASARSLADLIDDFDVAGDEQRCSEIYFGVIQQCRQPGAVRATALELLVANFYAHYAYREAGHLPTGDEAVPYDRLARELRASLIRLTSAQKTGFMSLIAQHETLLPEADNSQSTAQSGGARVGGGLHVKTAPDGARPHRKCA